MSNEKNIIATLKAEIITDITFVKASHYDKQKGMLYERDFEATIGVKVGNAVETLTLGIKREYVSTKGEYGTPTYVESHYLPYAPKISRNKFENLEEAGIEIDYTDVYTAYQAEVWKAKDIQKLNRATLKKERKDARRENYPTSWPLEFVKIVNADRNKSIVAADFTLTPSGKFDFIHKAESYVNVTYKNIVGHITKSDGRYIWTDGVSVGKNTNNYRDSLKISDGKTRRAKREGTTLLKFLEAVNEYLAIKESRKTSAKNSADKREIERLNLEKIAGYPVVIISERKYDRNHRGYSNGESYLIYRYMIVAEQPESSYSSPKGFTISKGGNYRDEEGTFSIRNLNNLNEKQFKTILDTLLEGRETFKKVVYPKSN